MSGPAIVLPLVCQSSYVDWRLPAIPEPSAEGLMCQYDGMVDRPHQDLIEGEI